MAQTKQLKTKLDKTMKDTVAMPIAYKYINSLPSDHKDKYDSALAEWTDHYPRAYNIAKTLIEKSVNPVAVQDMKQISDNESWNMSGLPLGIDVDDLKLEHFVSNEYDKIVSCVGDDGRGYHHGRQAFHLDQCIQFTSMTDSNERVNFDTYPSRSTFELVNNDYLKENNIGNLSSSQYSAMSWTKQQDYKRKVQNEMAYTNWLTENYNDNVVIRLNIDCHSQMIGVPSYEDFSVIKQEDILRTRMKLALDNLREEREEMYNRISAKMSHIRSVEGLLETDPVLIKIFGEHEDLLRGEGSTALALTPYDQMLDSKLLGETTRADLADVIILSTGISGTA